MPIPPFPIVYEDNHLLVINKPAGIATQGVTDGTSVYDQARSYLKQKYNKPGNVYIGIVSRLDTVTSGVLVVARTSKAASRLSEQIREGRIEKEYVAIVEGTVSEEQGTWVDHVKKDDRQKRMVVCRETDPQGQTAELRYAVTARMASMTEISVTLVTGRKHQIRLQCAHRECPIVGDRKYGATKSFVGPGIALHAHTIRFTHPTKKEAMSFTVPPPRQWAAAKE